MQTETNKVAPKTPLISSPQEEKFWTTPGEPSRVLQFSENLLDEEVNLGDVSTASFGSPIAGSSQTRPMKLFEAIDTVGEAPAVQANPFFDAGQRYDETGQDEQSNSSPPPNPAPTLQSSSPVLSNTPNLKYPPNDIVTTTETPTSRQRKIKVNIEVERIVVSLS